MIALIDSDTPIFAAALSAAGQKSWVATSRLDRTIDNLLNAVGCSSYKLFVSGEGNFRYDIDPSYKANRKAPDPQHRELCREHLIEKWGAISVPSLEADDLCGIYQSEDTVICGIDKDLLQIPGKHYQWELTRGGKVVREARFIDISPVEGLRNFYKQLLTGDVSDNIIGIQGIGPVKAGKLIDPIETEEDMREVVLYEYIGICMEGHDEEASINRFKSNANLLWIMRELGVMYEDREI